MFTPMARLLLLEFGGRDSIAARGRLRSIATGVRLPFSHRDSITVQLRGSGSFQHFGGALQRTLRDWRAVQHCGQFMLPRCMVECVDGRYDAAVPLDLGDLEMH